MSKAKAGGRSRRARDDLKSLRHIGEKSEQALNDAGIYTRSELLAANPTQVLDALQSAQRISGEVLEEVLREAARAELAAGDAVADEVAPGHEVAQSVHVFQIEVTVEAGAVVSTSTRHVVGGAPSTWPGFDLTRVRDFVEAAIGLTPDHPESGLVVSTPRPDDRVALSTPSPRRPALRIVRAAQDVNAADGDVDLVVRLCRDGYLPASMAPGDHVHARIFARSREPAADRVEIGSMTGTVQHLATGRLSAACRIPDRDWYGIEAVVELPSRSSLDPEGLGPDSLTLEIDPGNLPTVPSPSPLELARRHYRAAARGSPARPQFSE